jgi:hypothetical protein
MFVLCLPAVRRSETVTLGDTSTCPGVCGLCTLSFKGIILRTALHVMSRKSVIFAHAILRDWKPGINDHCSYNHVQIQVSELQ